MVEQDPTATTGEGSALTDVKDQAVGQAQELKDMSIEHVSVVTRDAKDQAFNVAHDVRREIESQGDSQARRLASALHDVGRQLHDMADGAEPGPLSQATRQLASGSERVAGRLEDAGIQGVASDLRTFAQRQPGLFLFTAGAAGFVVTRLLRNSGSSPHTASGPAPGSALPNGAASALPIGSTEP